MTSVAVIVPPTDIVSIDEVRRHLRLDDTREDDTAMAFVRAALSHVDAPHAKWFGRAIGVQTLEWRGSCFGLGGYLRLPFSPVISVASIKYVDGGGVEQTLSPDVYEVFDDRIWIKPGQCWPAVGFYPDAVRVRYVAGFGTVEGGNDVPDPIKVAVLMHAATLYENRSSVVLGDAGSYLPHGYEALLLPYRVWA
mgnify:CR=1 FL=1